MKVLLLDDETEVLASLERLFISMGHSVETYEHARDAIEPIQGNDFDFAFVDYRMPDDTGVWFLENANVPKKTKVLLMTAYVNRNVITRMFELGACGYLIKPFDEDEIRLHMDFHS
jgi:two-component system OmpR family response regulator